MIYIGITNYVVGQPLILFSFEAFRQGFDISFPLVVIFIPMFLVLSMVRHSGKNKVIGIITTTVLCLASWCFAVPAFLEYEIGSAGIVSVLKKQHLSAGYFRISDGELYYFTHVDAEGISDGIIINTGNNSTIENSFKVVAGEKTAISGSGDFSDILVRKDVEMPAAVKLCLSDLYFLSKAALKSFRASHFSWWFFCSFAVALICVFMISSLSSWRLVNAFYVVAATGLVIKLNTVCYGAPLIHNPVSFIPMINSKLYSLGGIFSYMESPAAVCVNLFLIFLFCAAFLVSIITSKKPAGDDE